MNGNILSCFSMHLTFHVTFDPANVPFQCTFLRVDQQALILNTNTITNMTMYVHVLLYGHHLNEHRVSM